MQYKLTGDIWSTVLAVMESEGGAISGAMEDALKMATHTGTLSLSSMAAVVALRRVLERHLKSNSSLQDEGRKALRRAIPALYSQGR